MFEFLRDFEQLAERFQSEVLIWPGLFLLVAGLCCWLGGLRFNWILAPFAGILTGLAVTFLVFRMDTTVSIFISALAGAAGAFVKKFFIPVLAGFIAGVLVLGVFMAGSPQQADWLGPVGGSQDEIIAADEALEITKTYTHYFSQQLKKCFYTITGFERLTIVLSVIATIGAGLIFNRLLLAGFFSVFGTALVFLAMIMLLLCKSSRPITLIGTGMSFYRPIFLVMAASGTVMQLLLAPTRSERKKEDDKEKSGE